MKKKLAIIGASYLQQPLVEKAKEMGIESICFAWEDGADGSKPEDLPNRIAIGETFEEKQPDPPEFWKTPDIRTSGHPEIWTLFFPVSFFTDE